MMRLPVIAVVLAVLTSPASRGQSKTPVTIYTSFEQSPCEDTIEEMKAELENIMLPVGVDFEWRSLEQSRGREVAAELVVVSFKGACNVDAGSRSVSPSGALGWTHMSDGDVLPFSDVHCDRIRQLIQPLLKSAAPRRKQAVLGRAIGRVVAHELYHIFTNNTRHAGGIAKPFYTAAELISERFRFHDKEARSLRSGKLRTLLEPEPQPAPVAGGQ